VSKFKPKSPEQRTLEKKAEGKITKSITKFSRVGYYSYDVPDTSPKTFGMTKRRAP